MIGSELYRDLEHANGDDMTDETKVAALGTRLCNCQKENERLRGRIKDALTQLNAVHTKGQGLHNKNRVGNAHWYLTDALEQPTATEEDQ